MSRLEELRHAALQRGADEFLEEPARSVVKELRSSLSQALTIVDSYELALSASEQINILMQKERDRLVGVLEAARRALSEWNPGCLDSVVESCADIEPEEV